MLSVPSVDFEKILKIAGESSTIVLEIKGDESKKEKTNEETQQDWENKILGMLEEEKKKKSQKKDSESMILRKPKKVTMFSDEAPMELPIAKMFSIGKK